MRRIGKIEESGTKKECASKARRETKAQSSRPVQNVLFGRSCHRRSANVEAYEDVDGDDNNDEADDDDGADN